MAEIKNLLPKLREEAETELEMFMGKKERQFFIEVFPAESVEKLLEEYTPTEHNAKWDIERQKSAPDPQVMIKERQSIAFMTAGKMGVNKRYSETELTAHTIGDSRMIRNLYFLSMTKLLVDPAMKMYEKG